MTDIKRAIVWFRQDLRLSDHPALCAAAKTGLPIVPVYVLDDANAGAWALGGASRWWLHQSLADLNRQLRGRLRFFRGKADEVLPRLARESAASGIYWNRCYEPWRVERDSRIKAELRQRGLEVQTFNGSLLFEPHTVTKADGGPYKVFTPFYRKGCLAGAPEPRSPLPIPRDLQIDEHPRGHTLDELGLMPAIAWYREMAEAWSPGERGAGTRLRAFLQHGLRGYKVGRDRPDRPFVSRLSPHLHFGEISPHQIWHAVSELDDRGIVDDIDHFRSELGWREFSYSLLYHWPEMTRENLQRKFDRFPWREDADALTRWQRGMTGYPIVDAGMRELWRTGYMHNRVRMITASFLVKNLLIHWHHGEDWFWDTLVDADLANNSASWQWVAGCGADAAPYFRIFNAVTQGRKFDPEGSYVRRFVPELREVPDRYVHHPREAPAQVLADAGVVLGQTYPEPIVDLKASRERALAAFKSLPS